MSDRAIQAAVTDQVQKLWDSMPPDMFVKAIADAGIGKLTLKRKPRKCAKS